MISVADYSPFSDTEAVFKKYRALGRNQDKFKIVTGEDKGDGRQLEYYPPWESWNPHPGYATVEVYNTAESPAVMQNLIAGDMLHYLGSIDPRTGAPVDPTYFKLKQQTLANRTPEQRRIDDRAYQRDLLFYENKPTPEYWMQFNRGDAYMRGYLTPDARDEWREMYTPQQRATLELARQYLARGSIAPGMNR